ncbi:hypothetical protein HQ576_07935 [bacterium]|nr:hypothetical protein [bacterium]
MPESPDSQAHDGVGHRIVRAMFVVIFFQLFWKFGGLIITVLVGSVFRAGPESDAYLFVSETVVFLLQTLCLKMFIPVVVPLFKEQLATNGEEAAWRFGSTVLCMALVVQALVTAGGMFFAPQITARIASGFNEQQAGYTSRLIRVMFPGVFAICLATVTYALLNSYNVFGYAAAGDALQKMLWAGVFLVASFTGLAASKARMLDVLAVAFLLGSVATLLTHLVGLRGKLKFLRFGIPGLGGRRVFIELGILVAHLAAFAAGLWAVRQFAPERTHFALQQAVFVVVGATYLLLLWWRAKGRPSAMAKFAALSVPLLFGILFAKYRDLLTNLFASFTGTGVFSDLKYARKIGEAPNTLIIAALSIAILPHLCELATGKKWTEFGHVMTQTIRTIVIFFVPLAALTVVLRQPIIALLFDRGGWSDFHLTRAGDALGLYILSLPFFAIENPIQQSFFAMQRMWTPTLIGFLGTGFHILFLVAGIEWLGYGYFAVVALVYVAARAFKNIILLLVMRAHVKILPWRESLIFLAKSLVITAAVVLATYYTYMPVSKALPLEPYRRHEVMIDTFNVELRGWESENVDELDIKPVADLNASNPRIKGNALVARYRPARRRSAGLRRDLSAFDLTQAKAITFDVATGPHRQLVVQLVTRDGTAHEVVRHAFGTIGVDRVIVPLDSPRVGKLLPDAVALWIRDVSSHGEGFSGDRADFVLDTLAIELRDGTTQTIDAFEPAAAAWTCAPSATRWFVEDTGERKGEPELALHVVAGAAEAKLQRTLAGLSLAGMDVLHFKARAAAACSITVSLSTGSSGVPTGVPVALKASATRKTYAVPVGQLGDLSAAGGASLLFSVPQGADVWLDNIAFVREPRGPRVGSVAVMYEVGKIIHVGVPALAALVMFIGLLILLRVEEARSMWAWLHQRVLRRVVAKLRRGE